MNILTPTILNLVLFSEESSYTDMYKITNEYYKKFRNVKTVYYCFSPSINNDYSFDKDKNILYIKGSETYIPGILDKTIKAFQFYADYKCDYVIRTNISTTVRFDLLGEELMKTPIEYGAGLVLPMDWKKELSSYIYASGTCIIFSKKTFLKLLEKKDLLDKESIDDVSIGILMNKELGVKALPVATDKFEFVESDHLYSIDFGKTIYYRNRNDSRDDDIKNMKYIVAKLLK